MVAVAAYAWQVLEASTWTLHPKIVKHLAASAAAPIATYGIKVAAGLAGTGWPAIRRLAGTVQRRYGRRLCGGGVSKRRLAVNRCQPARVWCAISDVSGHWTELFVVPVGRSVRPKGLHAPVDAPADNGAAPDSAAK